MTKASDNPFPSVLVVEGTTPSTPSAGDQRVYIDSTTHHLTRVNSSGATTDIEGAGGGAPTDATYLTQSSNGTLSAEVAFPGASGWQDAKGRIDATTAGGISEEYETGGTAPTFSPAIGASDVDTTMKSHLYMKYNSSTESLGLRSWSPGTGAFDARCHLTTGQDAPGSVGGGLIITDSGNSNRLLIQFVTNSGAPIVQAYTYTGGAYTQRGTNYSLGACRYFRITRDASNNCSFWASHDGLGWICVAAAISFTLTVANIGYRIQGNGGTINNISYSDWLRTSV